MKVKDCVEILDDKRIPLSSSQREKLEKKYRYYGAQGVIDYVDDYIFDGEYILVAEDGNNLKSLNENIATWATGKFWVNNHAHILGPKKGTNLKYVYYLINNLDLRGYITGSAQPKLNQENLANIELLLPIEEVQNKVANILSAIDKQIENNNRIIFKLESIAKTIYDYWFLQFEFPNEEGKPYKSSGGKMIWNDELKREIPEGWEVKTIGELVEVVLGGTPKTDKVEYWNGNINWLNSGEVAQFPVVESELKITEHGLNNSATVFMKRGTTIVSITGNIRTSFLAIDSCANQSVIGLLENDFMKKSYLHPLMKDAIDHYLKISTGNCQQHINKQTIKDTKLPLPPLRILNDYYKKCEPIYELISINGLNSKNLTSLRDFLLPMLINGQVTFKDKEDAN